MDPILSVGSPEGGVCLSVLFGIGSRAGGRTGIEIEGMDGLEKERAVGERTERRGKVVFV
jgi:hypothetical protein